MLKRLVTQSIVAATLGACIVTAHAGEGGRLFSPAPMGAAPALGFAAPAKDRGSSAFSGTFNWMGRDKLDPMEVGRVAPAGRGKVESFIYTRPLFQTDATGPWIGLRQVRLYEQPLSQQLKDYSGSAFWRDTSSIALPLVAVFGVGLTTGIKDWKWGSADRFRINREGWFGLNTPSGGMDKLGHAYTGYVLADFFTDRIRASGGHDNGAAITGALLSLVFQTFVEIGDGFSVKYGFSPEDQIMNAVGAGFSLLRNTVPGLKEKVDFRMQYWPSRYKSGFHPLADYSGKRYLLAWKFAGFDGLRDTPLKYFELHTGYYARGISNEERKLGIPRQRSLYVGVGLNLQELIFSHPSVSSTVAGQFASKFFQYYQPPFMAIDSSRRWR